MRRLIQFLKPYRVLVIFAVILTILISLLSTVRPYLVKIAIDEHILRKDKDGLRNIILFIFLLLIVQGLIQYIMTYLTQWIGQKTIYDLRIRLFRHVQNLSMSFFDRNPVGRLVTRLTNDIEVLSEMFSSGIVMVFADVFTIAGILVFMFTLSWKLTLICLSVLIPLIYTTIVFRKKVRETYRDVRTLVAKMNSYLQEHISGIMIVKIFGKEQRTYENFQKINFEHTAANKRSVLYYSVFFPVVELIGAVSVALIIWNGGGDVIKGTITIGVLISFLQYAEMFFRPIRDLSEKYNIMQTAMASSERIFRLLDNKSSITDSQNPVKLEKIPGEIEFRNVWFAYKSDNFILKNVSFSIRRGEKIAIVGATGAGKTSLMNLLCRFYEIQRGEILLDGLNIKDIRQADLRKHIGLVTQDLFLFSDSAENNINLMNKSINRDKIIEAAKAINIDEFISALPQGYNSNIMERGVTLSQGQRQLLTFARALVYNPGILILDEATSSVDTHSEILIRDAIDKLLESRTSIVIAHRLSTIQKCDRIIVMHKGEVREIGTHHELLELGGIYSKLYQLQYKESFIG